MLKRFFALFYTSLFNIFVLCSSNRPDIWRQIVLLLFLNSFLYMMKDVGARCIEWFKTSTGHTHYAAPRRAKWLTQCSFRRNHFVFAQITHWQQRTLCSDILFYSLTLSSYFIFNNTVTCFPARFANSTNNKWSGFITKAVFWPLLLIISFLSTGSKKSNITDFCREKYFYEMAS